MQYLKNTTQILMAFAIIFSIQACGDLEAENSQLYRAQSETGGTAGGKCRVVSGPNAGKTGTYDSEGWCTGTWGGTECKDSSGNDNGKCKDVKKVHVISPIVIGGPIKLN